MRQKKEIKRLTDEVEANKKAAQKQTARARRSCDERLPSKFSAEEHAARLALRSVRMTRLMHESVDVWAEPQVRNYLCEAQRAVDAAQQWLDDLLETGPPTSRAGYLLAPAGAFWDAGTAPAAHWKG